MKIIKIKADLDYSKLEELGYSYSVSEAGYISKDSATIVSIDRSPYIRHVMQLKWDAETEHMKNLEQLRNLNLLE